MDLYRLRLLYIILFNVIYVHALCPQFPPLIKLACPGAKIKDITTNRKCWRFNSSCCWDETQNDYQYPKCYYVPDFKQIKYNAALGKQVFTKSAEYKWEVTDGNSDSCPYSIKNKTNWFAVDLSNPMSIGSLTIITEYKEIIDILASKTQYDPDRAHERDFVTCSSNVTVSSKEAKQINCTEDIIARYVIIQTRTINTYFYLCEVEVQTAGRFNAAFGRATRQSSTFNDYNYDTQGFKSVDGLLKTDPGYCSRTRGNGVSNPWWSVDLGQSLKVHSVTIVNGHKKLVNVAISGSDGIHVPGVSGPTCANYTSEIRPRVAKTIECMTPITARYISIEQYRDTELNMCEVIVEADCPDGKYGTNCWNDCHCKQKKTCDKLTGYCPERLCERGYYHDDICNKACGNGRYGYSCSKHCHHCLNNATCNKTNGNCPQGWCNYGYKGEKCDKDIDECSHGNKGGCQQVCTNIYGSYKCDCNPGYQLSSDSRSCVDINECSHGNKGGCQQVCNNIYGSYECDCNPGYQLSSDSRSCVDINECSHGNKGGCQQVCNNIYGSYECDCNPGYQLSSDSRSCVDINECSHGNKGGCQQVCNNIYGSYECDCNPGYQLSSDSRSCVDINECSLGNKGGCQQVCTNIHGSYKCECNPGYQLTSDSKSCVDCRSGSFGKNCHFDCGHCRANATCRKSNGHCPSGCENGYNESDSRCFKECRDGTYGYNCRNDCHCKDKASCNKVTGVCPYGSCEKGYYHASICNRECANSTYGLDCRNDCNCRNHKSCNKVTGVCPHGLCEKGYYDGNLCNRECLKMTYGINCSQTCSSQCTDTCDKVTGHCTCSPGFSGPNCEPCPDGRYGFQCNQNCLGHCRNQVPCLKETGDCPEKHCQSGYMDAKCETPCPGGRYGYECSQNCSEHCRNQVSCLKETGDCPEKQCQAGYMDAKCETSCPKEKYGENCDNLCSPNCKDIECNSINGSCINGCKDGFIGDTCIDEAASIDGGVVAGIVLVVLFFLLIAAVILVLVLFLRRKKQKPKKYTQEENPETVDNVFANAIGMDSIKPNILDESSPLSNGGKIGPLVCVDNGYEHTKKLSVPPTIAAKPKLSQYKKGDVDKVSKSKKKPQKTTLILVDRIVDYVQNMRTNNLLKKEYESIPWSMNSVKYAAQAKLKTKNRYKNILPYDNNRVLLQKIGDDKLSDYINASYIEDYSGNKSFIAALGATECTVDDFWRMIWENNVSIILMLTNLVEKNQVKCHQYWAENTFTTKSDLVIQTENIKTEQYHTLRNFNVTKEDTVRQVTQYHYTDWPDQGVPDNMMSLINVIDFIKEHKAKRHTPILVHCSAGVGRTGTIIALDIMMEQAEIENAVDIYKCVHRLREQRTNMVQTQVQYELIHDYLKEILTVGVTAIHYNDLQKVLQESNQGELEKQFEVIDKSRLVYPKSQLEYGKSEHKDKNRDSSIIAADSVRTKLVTSPETYFNAVYIEGSKKKIEFCATQVPLVNTVDVFWRFMYEEKISCIVCLEKDPQYTKWLPKDKEHIFCGKHCIMTSDVTESDSITQYDVTIELQEGTEYYNVVAANANSEKESQKVKVFMLEHWSEQEISKRKPGILIDLYTQVQKWKKQNKNNITTVMCLNGCNETGLYIAASKLLDEVYQKIDVFHVVKQIGKKRPQMITSKEQYLFLHNLVQNYLERFQCYENVKV